MASRLLPRVARLRQPGQPDAVRALSELSDRWSRERLGVRTFDPIKAHQAGLALRPGSVAPNKHTFAVDYFRSRACRKLLKVAWEGAVKLDIEDGCWFTRARRPIRAGEIVEKGIFRGIAPGTLEDDAPNPFVCKLGQDFLLSTAFPWGKDQVGPSFFASGALMFYKKSEKKFNVAVSVRESHVQGFEFDAVAVEDIPEGCPLIRKVADDGKISPLPRYADSYQMSDELLDEYIRLTRERDQERAAEAGVEPEVLHEEVLRDHIHRTRSGEEDYLADRTVTLPHPSWPGFGVFACEDIKAGEIVEAGLHGIIEGLAGDKNPYVFTWNSSGKRHTDGTPNRWATGSGNAMFYNSDNPSNCRMYRLFDQFRYLIVAKTDIKEGEEVMHLYASSSWRKCFVDDEALPKLLPVEGQ